MTPAHPVSPEVGAKLDGAIATLATLRAQTEEVATSALKNERGADQKLSAPRKRIAEAETSVSELKLLMQVARKTDARAEAEHYQSLQAELKDFEAAAKAKLEAVKRFCAGAEQAAKAYCDIRSASFAMSNLVPVGAKFPPGLSAFSAEALIDGLAFPANTEVLAAGELFRHSGVNTIGKDGALPAAKALTASTLYRPEAVESWSASTARLHAYVIEAIKAQIEDIRRRELRSIEAATLEEAVNDG